MKQYKVLKIIKMGMVKVAAVDGVGLVKLLDGSNLDLNGLQTSLNQSAQYIESDFYKRDQGAMLLDFVQCNTLYRQGLSSYVVLRHKIMGTLEVWLNGNLMSRTFKSLDDIKGMIDLNTKTGIEIPPPKAGAQLLPVHEVVYVGFINTPVDTDAKKWEVITVQDCYTGGFLQLVDNIGMLEQLDREQTICWVERILSCSKDESLPIDALYQHLTSRRADITLAPYGAGFFAVFEMGNCFGVGFNGSVPVFNAGTLEGAVQMGKSAGYQVGSNGYIHQGTPVYVGFYAFNQHPQQINPQSVMSPLQAFGMPTQPIKAQPGSKAVWDIDTVQSLVGYLHSGAMHKEPYDDNLATPPISVAMESELLRRKAEKADGVPAGFTLTEVAEDSTLLISDSTDGKLWLTYKSPEQRQAMLNCLSKVKMLDIVGENALHYSEEILSAAEGNYWSMRDAIIAGGFTFTTNFTVSEVMISLIEGSPSITSNK